MATHTQNEDRTGRILSFSASGELLAAQVEQLYAYGRPALISAVGGALVLTPALWNEVSHYRLVGWLSVYLIVQSLRFLLLRAFYRASPPVEAAAKWGRLYALGGWLGGSIWGIAGILLFPSNSLSHQFLLAAFVTGVGYGAAVAYAPVAFPCYVSIILELAPLSGRFMYEGDEVHVTIGMVLAVFIVLLIAFGRNMNRMNATSLKLRFEKNDLIKTLTSEKTKAEDLNQDLMSEIKERRRVEDELRNSEQRLDLALSGADLGLWDWHIESGDLFLDHNWSKLLGYGPDEMSYKLGWMLPLIHPDDMPATRAAVNAHLTNQCPMFETEHRMRAKSGEWKWLLCRGKLVERSVGGAPSRMTGTCLDITQRKLAEAQVKASLDEKEVLLREIHHRVKNNLQVMSSLLRLQRRYVDDERYRGLLMESENRIASMALVHERLYQSPNLAELNAREYIDAIVRHVAGSFTTQGSEIKCNTAIEEVLLGIDLAITLGLMVTELCSNCFKHAFPGHGSGEVLICLGSNDTNGMILTVKDNGIGMAEDVMRGEPKSLGLRLVQIFANQLQARLDVRSDGGTEFRVQFETPRRTRAGLTT